jgi:hypothetical protein
MSDIITITSLNPYKLNRFEDEYILKLVCEYLNVKDAFKLRDKFEGQLFYDKIKMKLGAKMVCDNYFSIKTEIKASDLRNYNPSVIINSKRYYINTFNFNDKGIQQPIIDEDKIELNTIFVLFKNPNSFNIVGYSDGTKLKSILKKDVNDNHIKPKYVLNDFSLLDDVLKLK